MRQFLCSLLLVGCLMAVVPAADRFGVEFDVDAQYIKFLRGTEHGVHHEDSRPGREVPATVGQLRSWRDEVIGTFTVVFANEFDSLARVEPKPGFRLEQVEHLSIDGLPAPTDDLAGSFSFIPFERVDSENYFWIQKGWKGLDDPARLPDRGRGVMYDRKGRQAAQFQVVAVGEHRSLGYVTTYGPRVFWHDLAQCEIQGYPTQVIQGTGFYNLHYLNLVMIAIGLVFIYLGIAKEYEPLLLVPIGFGILIGNIPLPMQIFNAISVYMIDPVTREYVFNTTSNSVMGMIYFGVRAGIFPPLIFLGIGALTDFTALLSNPKSVLLGAAAQVGIFATFLGALWLGFAPTNAAAIAIIGGADGPTAIFIASRLAPALIGPIAIAAYSYMAMVPIIQPPIMKLLTTRKERLIRMKPGRKVSKLEKILFPIAGMLITTLVAPGGLPLLGMLFFGNLLKESGVTNRLSKTASSALLDISTILLGVAVGASTTAQVFLTRQSVLIFVLGCIAFATATAGGVMFAKLMNLFVKEKINPLVGAAGVSAVPDSARVVEHVGREYDTNNHLLMHAMGPNVAGVIGSAIVAGVFMGIF